MIRTLFLGALLPIFAEGGGDEVEEELMMVIERDRKRAHPYEHPPYISQYAPESLFGQEWRRKQNKHFGLRRYQSSH
jgi:hypothetical protein